MNALAFAAKVVGIIASTALIYTYGDFLVDPLAVAALIIIWHVGIEYLKERVL